MNFTSLYLKNFLSYTEETILLNKGTYLITGYNYDIDSFNGSGKSSITDGIMFALTGETPRGIKANSVINRKHNKTCIVKLEIEEGTTKYLIERGRKPNILNFYINGELTVGKDITETQSIIEKTLQINYNLFLHSIYFHQDSQVNFLTAPDMMKKELLTELLGLGLFEEIREKIKENIKIKERTVREIEVDIQKKQIYIDTSKAQLTEYSRLKDSFTKEVEEKIKELKEKNKREEKECREYLENASKDLNRLMNTVEAIHKEIVILENEKATLQTTIASSTEIVFKYKKILDEHKTAQEKARNEFFTYKNESDKSVSGLKAENTHIKADIQSKLKEIQRMEQVGEGLCSTCYQPISKETLQAEIIKGKQECLVKINKINETEQQIQNIQKQLAEKELDFKNNLLMVQQKINEIEKDQEKDLSDIKKKNLRLIEIEGFVRSKDQQRISIEREINEKNLGIKNKNERLSIIKDTNNKEVETLEKKENPYVQMVNDIVVTFESRSKEHEEARQTLEKEKLDLEYEEFLKEAFGSKGIRAYVIERIIDELNVKTNEYLTKLFSDNINIEFCLLDSKNTKGEQSLKFETSITYKGEEVEFGTLSGGEKCRCILATNLAISRLIQNRNTKNINLLILDESLNGMDSNAKELVIELLKEIGISKTVLCIEHDTEVKNLFDYAINVEKRNGESKII